jgi:hypothetical protein
MKVRCVGGEISWFMDAKDVLEEMRLSHQLLDVLLDVLL